MLSNASLTKNIPYNDLNSTIKKITATKSEKQRILKTNFFPKLNEKEFATIFSEENSKNAILLLVKSDTTLHEEEIKNNCTFKLLFI